MLLNDRKLLLMLDTAEETVERRLSIAEDTVDLRLDMLLEVLLLMLFQPEVMLDLKLLTEEVVVLFYGIPRTAQVRPDCVPNACGR